jgi:hypothetical protein
MRRIVIAFALAACASPAFAVQDRYGPPQTESPAGPHRVQLPPGALLDWNGKVAPRQVTAEPAALARPEPLAPWAQRMAPRPPQGPAVQPQPAGVAPIAAPVARQQAPVTPPPPAQARTLPAPVNAPEPYAARAAAAPPPVRTALAPGASARPRFYSVARQYGAQPDPIPVSAAPRGPALTLSEIPTSENLGRTQAPLDDGRANQAVIIPDTSRNAASNRISRYGL